MIKVIKRNFHFLVESVGPLLEKRVNFVLVTYTQSTEQLFSSGLQTLQFILSTVP